MYFLFCLRIPTELQFFLLISNYELNLLPHRYDKNEFFGGKIEENLYTYFIIRVTGACRVQKTSAIRDAQASENFLNSQVQNPLIANVFGTNDRIESVRILTYIAKRNLTHVHYACNENYHLRIEIKNEERNRS